MDYLGEFATLMRRSLDFSRREYITLEEEIEFLKLYVDLETKRFGKPIDFQVHLQTKYESKIIAFPALLLQPIVENCIVHGLQGIDYPAMVKLQIIEHTDYFDIEISDNGVGIKQDGKSNDQQRKSHGLEILKNRIRLYNAVQGNSTDLQVLENSIEGKGTLIRIKLYKVKNI